jgi:hypothetical protein
MTPPETSAPPTRWWRVVFAYLPPALLVAVALSHVILARTSDLSPWKGGGFGMFATIDSPTRRFLAGHVIVDGRVVPIMLPGDDPAGDALTRALTLPSQARLDALTDTLAKREWYLNPTTNAATPRRGRSGTDRRIYPRGLRLEVHRILFNRDTLEVERLLLAESTRDLR